MRLLATIGAIALVLSCGGGQPSVVSGQPSDSGVAPPFQAATPSETTLDEALADLDALPTPAGVDESVFSALKSALREALLESVGRVPGGAPSSFDALSLRRGTSPAPCSSSSLTPTKLASRPPTGEANKVDDLALTDNGDGTYTLTWSYRNCGDYNQDGTVNIMDITPLAVHFNEEADATNEWIDGNDDGVIDIKDITPLAANFFRDVAGYAIEGATVGGEFSGFASVDFPVGAWHAKPLQLTFPFSAGDAGALARFRVVPVDSWGEQGIPSNEVELPVSAPEIHSVTPTEWFTGEECTFTAAVSGTRPLNFSWDFGSGADPNEVTGNGDEVIAEVILGEPGEYEASLAVSNLYGEDTCPFTLTVAERESWAHTWGGAFLDRVTGVATDEQGNAYVAGHTFSFGAGASDALLLKYDATGSLLLSKTWGGEEEDSVASIAIDRDGNIYMVGHTASSGVGESDLLLLKYDSHGDLLWARTWGASWIERARAVTVDTDGNVLVAGERSDFAYDDWDVLLLKCGPDGEFISAACWGSGGNDWAKAISTDSRGDVYLAGYTNGFGAGDDDVVLLKFDAASKLLWAKTWGGEERDYAMGTAVDAEGYIYVTGVTESFALRGVDGLLLKYHGNGSLIWARTWDGTGYENFNAIAVDASGRILVAGVAADLDLTVTHALLLGYDSHGDLDFAWGWTDGAYAQWAFGTALDAEGNVYLAGTADDSSGAWQELSGAEALPEGVITSPEGLTTSPDGIDDTPLGTETSPEGTLDQGAGEGEALLLKNFPK